jgi:hypothetical protein
MLDHGQSTIVTPTVTAHRVDGGYIVTASPEHFDEDWQAVITRLQIADVVVDSHDFLATSEGRLIWWVADDE